MFMHRFAIVVVVGCGAAPAPAPSPAQQDDIIAAQPASTPPTTSARILERLPIREGKMPGLPFEVTVLPTANYCGGVSVGVVAIASAPGDHIPLGVAEDDFRRVLTLEMPNLDDLGGGRDEGLRVANRLAEWTKQALRDFSDVQNALHLQLSKGTSFEEEIATLARLVQIEHRFAEVFARAPIPAPFAAEPARSGWCDSLADKVEGLVDAAERDAEVCRKASAKNHAAGWWVDACADLAGARAAR